MIKLKMNKFLILLSQEMTLSHVFQVFTGEMYLLFLVRNLSYSLQWLSVIISFMKTERSHGLT
jgi:hypothetical protein